MTADPTFYFDAPQTSHERWTAYDAPVLTHVVERMARQTAEALVRGVGAADPYTGMHVRGVATLSERIATRLGLEDSDRRRVCLGGLLHDVGKLAIPPAILKAPRRLDAQEMALVRTHPDIGAQIVADLDLDQSVKDAVRHHHERWDGGGYPSKLAGTEIPFSARIVAVADTMHALTKGRPYRGEAANADVIRILEKGAGSQWDTDVIAAAVPLLAA